ncbi:MAG: hypothetical protein J6A01_04640 [Proteobacteria bacterium]|nr:hypothetical protein [Pseudomonadota bacterium]
MDKRLVSLLGAIGLCLCACNERVEYTPYYADCTPESFSPTCAASNTYTACMDNRIVIRICADSHICMNGVCTPNMPFECSQDTFLSTCVDDNYRSICNSQNTIEMEACPSGTQCKDGQCTAPVDHSCESGSFVAECTDETHYTACRSGVTITEACEGETVCVRGTCITQTECDRATYVPECLDGARYTFCTEDGRIIHEDCPANTKCVLGECRENASDVCEPDGYVNACDGSKRVACDNGRLTEYDCADDGLVCYEGECRVVGTVECDRKHFVDKCIGDTLAYCSDEHLGVVSTDNCKKLYHNSGICATVDGVTGCYRTCNKKDVQDHADSICEPGKPDYLVTGGECVQMADNQYVFVVPQNTETMQCDTDETDICKDGSCVKDDRLGTACNPQTDATLCDGERLYYCDDDGRYDMRFCYGKCFAINDVTDCYKPCMLEGDSYYEEDDDTDNDKAIKFECTQTDSGLYYVPREAECFGIIDSLGNIMFGSMGFAYSGDICVNQKSEAESDSCNGNIAKKVVHKNMKDSNGEWIPVAFEISTDCGSQNCVVQDGEAFCADPCTAEDMQNARSRYACDFYEMWQEELEYVSQSYSCVRVGDAYYWKFTGSESCPHGCAADQSCHRVHRFEGTSACYSYMDEINFLCDDNIFLDCYGTDVVGAYDCGDRVCSDSGSLGCFDTYDEADAGKTPGQ